MNIIDNPKVLKRLNNEGLIEWPITRHGVKPNGKPFSYVDEVEKVGQRGFSASPDAFACYYFEDLAKQIKP